MSPAERIITVESLSKSYHIWSSPLARLQGPAYQWLADLPLLPTGWRKLLRRKAGECSREFFALHDVSFHVERGQSVGIIGRNGSGKSTLLQMITGTLQPSGGQAEIRGRVAALLELGSGFNPEFTGRDNARLNAALHGLTPAEIDARLGDMLAFADIGEFVDQPVKTYSSGMMLRLAFAVVAHIDADILIIDEALAVGDVFFVQKCMAFLQRFQERGVLLLVSHSAAAITALCQKALWLDAGHLRLAGSPKEVTEAYLEAFFAADTQTKRPADATPAGATPAMDATATAADDARPVARRDQRLLYLNQTQYRNDLEIFEFDPKAASFGLREGQVVDVALEGADGHPLAWIVGGEVVSLKIRYESAVGLAHPIIGFYVKNGLGQQLFGDNTFFSSRGQDLEDGPDARYEAFFTFQMPVLPPGDYVITVALADGTQTDHIMHHWIHDALAFKSVSSPLRAVGLLGLPMIDVGIQRVGARTPALTAA